MYTVAPEIDIEYDPMVGPPDGGKSDPAYLVPSVIDTSGGNTGIRPPVFGPIAPISFDSGMAPQQLPDLVGVYTPAKGVPWGLVALLAGAWALTRGRGRGTMTWGK